MTLNKVSLITYIASYSDYPSTRCTAIMFTSQIVKFANEYWAENYDTQCCENHQNTKDSCTFWNPLEENIWSFAVATSHWVLLEMHVKLHIRATMYCKTWNLKSQWKILYYWTNSWHKNSANPWKFRRNYRESWPLDSEADRQKNVVC